MTYVFDNAWENERQRLAALESIWDPGSIRILEEVGVSEGWRCLEVGGGGGSIAHWLCKKVGDAGKVVATDLDTRFLEAIGETNLDVLQHDITKDPMPDGGFDLIHSRAVIEHVSEKSAVIANLFEALAPGGYIVIEDFDWLSGAYPIHPTNTRVTNLYLKIQEAVLSLFEAGGYVRDFGRRLPSELIAAGLEEVRGEGRTAVVRGATPECAFYRLALEQFRDGLIGSGLLTEEDIADGNAIWDDPNAAVMTPVVVAAWGRRPR